MEAKSKKVNTFLFFFIIIIIILLSSHHSLGAPKGTWVGSKYHIECTMCAACDNPCNQQPPSSLPQPTPSPPPPSSTGGGYYYSLPPPSSTGGGYYYSPPPPSQGAYYYYPPAATGNYPAPGTPNPITNYFPYYYHNSPQYDSATVVSLSGATVAMLVINILLVF